MKEQIILIGGGGHCRSCIDVIEQQDSYVIAGILEVPERQGQNILSYQIIGTDNDIPEYVSKGYHFLTTIGQIKTSRQRLQLHTILEKLHTKLAIVISPLAYVSPHAQIGKGTIVMHGAVVNASATIGCNCIINTRAVIEHDATVGDHCHISTSAVINGGSHIQPQCFIGSQAMVREGITIGTKTIIGAGTTILKDIAPNSLVKMP